VILLTSVIHAALYSRDWFGAVRTEATTPRHTPDPCTTNNRMKEGIPHFIPTEQSFTSIDWLSSAAAPMDPGPEDSQHVRFAGPDVLLDESDLASCFTFSGEHGGVTIVSNSSRHRITHFTLDNSLVNGVIDPTYYPGMGRFGGCSRVNSHSVWEIWSSRMFHQRPYTFCWGHSVSPPRLGLRKPIPSIHPSRPAKSFYSLFSILAFRQTGVGLTLASVA
jgi:hypothetical protein